MTKGSVNVKERLAGATPAALLLRPGLFTGTVCLGTFALAGIAIDERRAAQQTSWEAARQSELMDPPDYRYGQSAIHALQRKLQTLGPIIATNAAVYLAWLRSTGQGGVEAASPILRRFFLHYPLSGRALPLLLCTFSHATLMHFGFNMFALWSFGGMMLNHLPSEQFIATYLSAGVITSFGSLCISVLRRSSMPSLGASGAVLTLAAMTAAAEPNLNFALIFFPWLAFPAKTMLAGIVALDMTGLVLRWGFFDHAAHLTGSVFGYCGLGSASSCHERGLLMRGIEQYQGWVCRQVRQFKANNVHSLD
eukprot:g1824.t1